MESTWRALRRQRGERGEHAALAALRQRGYLLLARNVRSRLGEMDLVCRDGDSVVFCEVKARRPSRFGTAIEALSARKRARLERLANAYLAATGWSASPWRIELVAVTLDRAGLPIDVEVIALA